MKYLFLFVIGLLIACPQFYTPVRDSSIVIVGQLGSGICSGWVAAKGIVVTAGHCVSKKSTKTIEFIDGHKVTYTVYKQALSETQDYAILLADTGNAKPIALCTKKVLPMQTLVHIGYEKDDWATQRKYKAIAIATDENNLWIGSEGFKGNSGSVVLNYFGEAVGIMSQMVFLEEESYPYGRAFPIYGIVNDIKMASKLAK